MCDCGSDMTEHEGGVPDPGGGAGVEQVLFFSAGCTSVRVGTGVNATEQSLQRPGLHASADLVIVVALQQEFGSGGQSQHPSTMSTGAAGHQSRPSGCGQLGPTRLPLWMTHRPDKPGG
ncbi:Uncharacterised protein [Mycobacteroides abscessus subsp. abscessus]|nr:Uncharacterised protein [Mycobacteroides abscessus subsp. abscessus]